MHMGNINLFVNVVWYLHYFIKVLLLQHFTIAMTNVQTFKIYYS